MLAFIAVAGPVFPVSAQSQLICNKTGDSVVDTCALTINGRFGQSINGQSFQQDAVSTHLDYQYVGYYDGKLHTTWVWREWTQGPNHDLMYACSEDGGRTWLNNAGQALKIPPRVESPGITVVEIGRGIHVIEDSGLYLQITI